MRGASYPKLTACVACIAVLSMGGVIFGIAGLYPALYIRGFWEGMCDTAMCDLRGDLNRVMSVPYEQLSRFATSLLQVFTEMPPGVVPEACCSSQVLTVGVVTSVAFAITDGSSAVWGELNDRLGPKWGISVAVGLVVLSQLLLVLASSSALRINDQLATAAFFGIGAGGAGVTTAAFVGCTLAVAASSSDMQAYLSTGLAATFDISAIIFPLVSELHQMGVSLPIIVAFVWLPLSAVSGGWLIWLFSEPAPPPKQTGAAEGRQRLARWREGGGAAVDRGAAEVHGEGWAGVHPAVGAQLAIARLHVRVHHGDHLSRVGLRPGVQAAVWRGQGRQV